jgi:ribosomal protein L32
LHLLRVYFFQKSDITYPDLGQRRNKDHVVCFKASVFVIAGEIESSCLLVLASIVQCATSAFRDRQRQAEFTLKIPTATFAETLDNYQHSTRPIPESRTYTEKELFLIQSL